MRFVSRTASFMLAMLLAGGAAGCGGGFSGPSLSETERVFLSAAGSWDTNHDGVVTCDEWKAYVNDLFNGADKNRDGFLDPAEFAVMSRTDRMFETVGFSYFDANHDGKIARAEITDRPNPAFVLLDKKRDCQLTSTELTGARSLLTEAQPTVSAPSSSPTGDPTRGPPTPGR